MRIDVKQTWSEMRTLNRDTPSQDEIHIVDATLKYFNVPLFLAISHILMVTSRSSQMCRLLTVHLNECFTRRLSLNLMTSSCDYFVFVEVHCATDSLVSITTY